LINVSFETVDAKRRLARNVFFPKKRLPKRPGFGFG